VADAYGDDEMASEYQTVVEELLMDFDQHEPRELDTEDLDGWINTSD